MNTRNHAEKSLPLWAQERLAKLREERYLLAQLALDPEIWGDRLVRWAVETLRDNVLKEGDALEDAADNDAIAVFRGRDETLVAWDDAKRDIAGAAE